MQVCREAKRLGDSGGWEIKVLGENGQKVVKKAHGKRKRDKPAAKDASASGPTEDGGEETEAPQASTEPTTALEGPMGTPSFLHFFPRRLTPSSQTSSSRLRFASSSLSSLGLWMFPSS